MKSLLSLIFLSLFITPAFSQEIVNDPPPEGEMAGSTGEERQVEIEAIVNYPMSDKVFSQPKNCEKKMELPCAIQTKYHHKYYIPMQGGRVTLASSASVQKISNTEIRYIEGVVWVNAISEEITVRHEYGKVNLVAGTAYIMRDNGNVVIRNVNASVNLIPKGKEQSIELPKFWENWMGKFNPKKNRSSMGIPKVYPFKDHIQKWSRVYGGTRTEFRKEVQQAQFHWSDAVFASSEFAKEKYKREVASDMDQKQRAAERKKRREARESEMKKLFRHRNSMEFR